MMLLNFLLILNSLVMATGLEAYKQREQSYRQWLAERSEEQKQRESAAQEVRVLRARRELDAIRRRKQFQREFRTTQGKEADYLQQQERFDRARLKTREQFADERQQALRYYERYVLPLKTKEYGLDETPVIAPTPSQDSAE